MASGIVNQRTFNSRQFALVGQCFLVVILVAVALLRGFFTALSAELLIYLLCVILLGVAVWSAWSWRQVAHSLFDPYILFLAAAILFNGGRAILEVFQLNVDGILEVQFSSEVLVATLSLVIAGLISFHFGGLLGAALYKSKRSLQRGALELRNQNAKYVRAVGWLLLLVSVVPAFFILRQTLQIAIASGYFALFQRQAGTGFGAAGNVLTAFLVPGAMFLLAGSKSHKAGLAVSAIVILSYILIQFAAGSRMSATAPLIAYAWVWHRVIRPLPKTLLIVVGVFILFVLFPLVEVTRTIAGGEKLAPSFLITTFLTIENPVIKILSEMGGSMKTVAYTLELVPAIRAYDFGASYLNALLTIIPNIYWDIHPAIAHGLLANWLVTTVDPARAAQGGGLGFSFIAEAYLNFGWFGAPIALGVIGAAYARFVLWAQISGEPARMASVASFVSYFVIYARGETGSVVRALVWYAFMPYVAVLILSRLKNGGLNIVGSREN